jgi:cytidylate kinase
MKAIGELFDQDINRRIEKVIQYQTTDNQLLEQEVREYIATDAIKSNLERLLDEIDDGMTSASDRNVGIWVSGFYGSGKSSFTKYIGYALDSKFGLGGKRFRDLLKTRIDDVPLQQRLETVAQRHNPVVILLDLSVDADAQNHTMPVSSIVYSNVLRWAGYSRDIKIAHLERMAEQDGRFDELIAAAQAHGRDWSTVHNNPIVGGRIASQIAVAMYPKLFQSDTDFYNLKIDERHSQREQIDTILELIRTKSERENVLFIIDEAGQYVAQSDSLVLNLQGFAQNLQAAGKGRAWVIATAQQTLTDDVGALNSPKLFKLKDRFGITVELKADDIKEITHRRLLSKKPAANEVLGQLFDAQGSKLNVRTRLEEVKGYTSSVQRGQFIDLYPFLPQHFDLMMNIIARLAKSTGGTGLRSAIKVVQETLTASGSGKGVAARQLGELVTIVDFYDVLQEDLSNSPQVRHTVDAVKKTLARYEETSPEVRVAKAVAVMQIMDDFPLTRHNLGALLVRRVDADDEQDVVTKAIDTLLAASDVPLEEVDRTLRFLSDKVAELQRKWKSFDPTSHDQRQVLTDVINDDVLPARPKATIFNHKQVSAGRSLSFSDYTTGIDQSPDGITVELRIVPTSAYQAMRTQALNESTTPAHERLIVALAAEPDGLREDLRDAYASARMIREMRAMTRDGDEEQFYRSMTDRERNAKARIADALTMAFEEGTVIHGGQDLAVKTTAKSTKAALDGATAAVGKDVYDKYEHAAGAVALTAAEKIVKSKDASTLSSQDDPLALLGGSSGSGFQSAHAAVVDIRDYINQNGTVDGKTILDDLSKPPYGWNKDVARYVLACMFTGGALSLRVGGQQITSTTPAVIEAFKSNQAFAKVGIDAPPQPLAQNVLKRAKDNLVELTGASVTPIPKNLEEAARHALSESRESARVLENEARVLRLGVTELAREVATEIENMQAAGQQAVLTAFGADPSAITERLLAVGKQHKVVTGPFRDYLKRAGQLIAQFSDMPDSGAFGVLKSEDAESVAELGELLADQALDTRQARIQEIVQDLEEKVAVAAQEEWKQLRSRTESAVKSVQTSADWSDLSDDQRAQAAEHLDAQTSKLAEATGLASQAGANVVDALLKISHASRSAVDDIREYVAKSADQNRKVAAVQYTDLSIPTGALAVAEAKQVLEQMRDELDAAPVDRRVRFRAEG